MQSDKIPVLWYQQESKKHGKTVQDILAQFQWAKNIEGKDMWVQNPLSQQQQRVEKEAYQTKPECRKLQF